MSLAGDLLVTGLEEVGGRLLEGAPKPAVGSQAETTRAFEVEGGKMAARELVEGPDQFIRGGPVSVARKASADLVNDAIIDGLHHVEGFKQIIDTARDARSGIFNTVDKMHEVGEDVEGGEEFSKSYKQQFGEEAVGKIEATKKRLDVLNYKQSDLEKAQTAKLIKHQSKVFDILHKYEKIAGKQKMSPELKQAMNDEITAAYSGKIDGQKIGTFAENAAKHKKAFINNVYDYPKKNIPVTDIQRERVFSAIEKDIKTHDVGNAKGRKYRGTDGHEKHTTVPFDDAHEALINKHLTTFENEVKNGDIYIDTDGALKITSDNNHIITASGRGGNLARSKYAEMLSDVVANSKRIPQESKDILLKDFNKSLTDNGKAAADGKFGKTFQAKIDINSSKDIPKNLFRNEQAKKDFDGLRAMMGDLGDLKNTDTINNDYGESVMTTKHANTLHPASKKGVESLEDFTKSREKLTDEQKKSIEDLGGTIGRNNTVSNWDAATTKPKLTKAQKLAIKRRVIERNITDLQSPKVAKIKQFDDMVNEPNPNIPRNINQKEFSRKVKHDNFDIDGSSITGAERAEFKKFKPKPDKFEDVEEEPIKQLKSLSTRGQTLIKDIAKEKAFISNIQNKGHTAFGDEAKIANANLNISKFEKELAGIKSKTGQIQIPKLTEKQLKQGEEIRTKDAAQKIADDAAQDVTARSDAKFSKETAETQAANRKEFLERNRLREQEKFDKGQMKAAEKVKQNQITRLEQEAAATKKTKIETEKRESAVEKFGMSSEEYLDKVLFNKEKIRGALTKSFTDEEIVSIKSIMLGDDGIVDPFGFEDTDKEILKNDMDNLLKARSRALKNNKIVDPDLSLTEKALATKPATGLKSQDILRGGTPKPSDVRDNIGTKGTTFTTTGLEKLEEQSLKESSMKQTQGEKPVKTVQKESSTFIDLDPEIPDSLGQLDDGTIFIKNIDEFSSLSKNSDEYKAVEEFVGGAGNLEEFLKKSEDDPSFAAKSQDGSGKGIDRLFGDDGSKSILDNVKDFASDNKSNIDAVKDFTSDNKGKILGGAAAAAGVGAIIGEESKVGDALGTLSDATKSGDDAILSATKEGTETITKTITSDGDGIKKKLEDLKDVDGKNVAIAQIITNADKKTEDPDITPREKEQLQNSLKDLETQIDRLKTLQGEHETVINQVNEPTTHVSTNTKNRRRLVETERFISQRKQMLDTKAKKLRTDTAIVERRKSARNLKKEAIKKAQESKDKRLENDLRRGVLKPSQPSFNIINNIKTGNLKNINS